MVGGGRGREFLESFWQRQLQRLKVEQSQWRDIGGGETGRQKIHGAVKSTQKIQKGGMATIKRKNAKLAARRGAVRLHHQGTAPLHLHLALVVLVLVGLVWWLGWWCGGGVGGCWWWCGGCGGVGGVGVGVGVGEVAVVVVVVVWWCGVPERVQRHNPGPRSLAKRQLRNR